MLFSIIVPVYNVEKYLSQCVESVINQSMPKDDYEIILVDDGSKDNCGAICDWYSANHSNVKVIHKENGGLSNARNCGVRAAAGDYILFVDSDDFIAENSLDAIKNVIYQNSEPDLVFLECCKFYDNSTEVTTMQDGVNEKVNGLRGDSLYSYCAKLAKFPASACTKAINRLFLIQNDLYFEVGRLSEDLDWSMRLFISLESAAYCPNEYYFYRQSREGSIGYTLSEKKVADILWTFSKWEKKASMMHEDNLKSMICSFEEYIFRFIILYYNCFSKEKRKQCKSEIESGSWLLGSRTDTVSKIIRISYKCFGLKLTGSLLRIYLSVRMKKERGYVND